MFGPIPMMKDQSPAADNLGLSKAAPLDRLAERLRRHHAGQIATLVDLSAIPNIHSRIMFRSMARFIEEHTVGEPIDALPLARNIVVLLSPYSGAQRLKDRLEELSLRLQEQRLGSLRLRQFDIDSQADHFVEVTRQLMVQAPAPASARAIPLRDEPPPDFLSLNHVIDLHRILGQADLANQCRRQTLWRLEPDMVPVAVADEIWVSISALEQITGLPLRDNLWLFGKTTELLDQRVISQIMSEHNSLRRPLSINLHLSSVISTAFLRVVTEKPASQVHQMIVEVPLVEWRKDGALRRTAAQILERHSISLCLDGILPQDIAHMNDDEWQAPAFLKFDAAGDLLSRLTAELESTPANRRPLLQQKGVFCHCDGSGAVAAGLAHGIRHFQGRGLTPLLEDVDTMEKLLGRNAADGATAALKGL
ncbi:MAG: hypothetical protein VW600_07275 [Ferrovibrio sp.]